MTHGTGSKRCLSQTSPVCFPCEVCCWSPSSHPDPSPRGLVFHLTCFPVKCPSGMLAILFTCWFAHVASISDCCPLGQDQSNYSMESVLKCDLNAFLIATAIIIHGDSGTVLEIVRSWCSSTTDSLWVNIGFGELARLKYLCNPGRGSGNRGEKLEQTVYESHLDSAIYLVRVLSWKSTMESESLDISLFYWVPASYQTSLTLYLCLQKC